MKKPNFEDNYTYLPVTMQQFETLTNEILKAVNEVTAPHYLSSDYMVQILMSAIHAYDHKTGIVKKSDLFESCVNRISCHVTYHASEAVRAKLQSTPEDQAAETNAPSDLAVVPDEMA
jgi:hypothetical protein